MQKCLAISLALLLTASGCAHNRVSPTVTQRVNSPVDLSNASDSELQQQLGETVVMRGKFSLRGKVGPFVVVSERPIYFVSKGSFSWGKSYAEMEGKEVRVTGTLRFVHYPDPPPTADPVGRPSDHFYFEAETAKVELVKK